MTHEPECPANDGPDMRCYCQMIQRAYRRGFRDGYNAHATAALEWKATHGAYPQHGKGENP